PLGNALCSQSAETSFAYTEEIGAHRTSTAGGARSRVPPSCPCTTLYHLSRLSNGNESRIAPLPQRPQTGTEMPRDLDIDHRGSTRSSIAHRQLIDVHEEREESRSLTPFSPSQYG